MVYELHPGVPLLFLINVLKCATRASLRKLPSERINREVRQAGQVHKIGHKERAQREECKFDLENRTPIVDTAVSHCHVYYVVCLSEHNIYVSPVFERTVQWSKGLTA